MKVLSKRFAALFLALILAASMTPSIAMAAEEGSSESLSVEVIACIEGAFALHENVTVTSEECAKAGYDKPEECLNEVTALDAVCKLHEAMFGDDYNADPSQYLVIGSSGYMSKIFGVETYDAGYLVNNEPGVSPDYLMEDGDRLVCFMYQDTDYYSDEYMYFDQNTYTAASDEDLTMVLASQYAGWGGEFDVEGHVVGLYDVETDELKAQAAADADGKVVFSDVPAGEYYATIESLSEDKEPFADLEEVCYIPPYAEVSIYDVISAKVQVIFNEAGAVDFAGTITVNSNDASKAAYANDDPAAITSADALAAFHGAYIGDGFWKDPKSYLDFADPYNYGDMVVKIVGKDTTALGFYLNDDTNTYLAATVADDDIFHIFLYQDTSYWSDQYLYFSEDTADSFIGKPVEMTLVGPGYDANWNVMILPQAGYTVALMSEDGSTVAEAVTDADGKVSMTGVPSGDYYATVTAGPEGVYYVAPYFPLTVVSMDVPVLTAAADEEAVTLTWTETENAAGYVIYRKVDDGAYERLAEVTDPSVLTYLDEDVVVGTRYAYKVKPYSKKDGKRVSGTRSAGVAVYLKPAKAKVTLTAGTKKITVKWAKQEGVDGYVVYKSTEKNGTYKVAAKFTGDATVKYVDTKVTVGKTYYYKVRSYVETSSGAKKFGAYSAVKSAAAK